MRKKVRQEMARQAAADLEAANAALKDERIKVLAKSKLELVDQTFPAVLSPDVFDDREEQVFEVGTSAFDFSGMTFSNSARAEYFRGWSDLTLYRKPMLLDEYQDIVRNQPSLPNPKIRSALGPQSKSLLQVWFEKEEGKVVSVFIGLPDHAPGQEYLMDVIAKAGELVVPFPAAIGQEQRDFYKRHFEEYKQIEGDFSTTRAVALVRTPSIWDPTFNTLIGATDERLISVPLVVGQVPDQPNVTGLVISAPWSKIGDFVVLPQDTGWNALRVLAFRPGVTVPATLELATQDFRSMSQFAEMLWGTEDQEQFLVVLAEQINEKGCFTPQERRDSKTPWW
jgi:hypothetical protein